MRLAFAPWACAAPCPSRPGGHAGCGGSGGSGLVAPVVGAVQRAVASAALGAWASPSLPAAGDDVPSSHVLASALPPESATPCRSTAPRYGADVARRREPHGRPTAAPYTTKSRRRRLPAGTPRQPLLWHDSAFRANGLPPRPNAFQDKAAAGRGQAVRWSPSLSTYRSRGGYRPWPHRELVKRSSSRRSRRRRADGMRSGCSCAEDSARIAKSQAAA